MFEISSKIKRAWKTIWDYKILWLFVFLLALTGANGGGGGGGGGGSSWSSAMDRDYGSGFLDGGSNTPEWLRTTATWIENEVVPLFMPDRVVATVIWMMVIIFGISLLMGLLLALVRYPSETAVLRMVNDYEETGKKIKFKEGWKLGWNIRAFRLWLVDLIVGAPAFVVIVGLLAGIAVFVTRMIGGENLNQIPGMIGLIVLAGLLLFALAIAMVFVGMWREYISREIAIQGASLGEAFKQGWAMLAHYFKNTILTWLVMLAIGLGFGFALVLVIFLLIPVYAVLAIPGAVVGAIPGALVYAISTLFTANPLGWIIAAIVFISFFFTVVFSPVTLLNGLFMLFGMSVWTQTYREIKNGNRPAVLVESDAVQPPPLG